MGNTCPIHMDRETRAEYRQIEIDYADATAWHAQHVLKWLLLNHPKIYDQYTEDKNYENLKKLMFE